MRWDDKTWEIQHDRGVPIRRLPTKEAKAASSPKSRGREGQVQPRTEANNEMQTMDFDSYAAHFALTPERQAEVDRRMREDLEQIAAKEAEIEAKRVADVLDRVEKEKIERN